MTQPRSDPYADLGITRDASQQQVQEAYRRLAKRYHPDLHPDAAMNERMQRINQAWHVLSSPIRRARFDAANEARSRMRTHWAGSRFEPSQGADSGWSWPMTSYSDPMVV